jgi:hypothetical protein
VVCNNKCITSADALIHAAEQLAESAAARGFRGPDPYDGLLASWPPWLVAGRRRRQALVQLHARTPVDVRRLYRREHALIPKALGAFGAVGVRAARLRGLPRPAPFALRAIDLLLADDRAPAWGYPWDVQTRWSFYPAGRPNIVVTAFAAAGLLEAGAALSRDELTGRAQAAATWVVERLWVEEHGYFAYHDGQPVPTNIHNASMLGAWLVHVALGTDPMARERVARAVDRTLGAQRRDGSWGYGERRDLEWADSFHTGYVLTCLDRLREVDPRVGEAVARGATYYRRFFDVRGRARLWPDRAFPEDGHSAGTGLTTLALLRRRGLVEPELLARVVARLLERGLRGGHAVHRRYRRGRSTVHYLRWCDAHVAIGLVDAAAAMLGEADLAPQPPGRMSRRRDTASLTPQRSERASRVAPQPAASEPASLGGDRRAADPGTSG